MKGKIRSARASWLFGDPLLSVAGLALLATGIVLSIQKRALAALPLLLFGIVCLVVAGPNRGQLDKLTLDGHGKVTIKFKATVTAPDAAPDAKALRSSAVDALGRESGSTALIRDLQSQSTDVLNPFFDFLRQAGFVPIVGFPNGRFRPGDIVDTANGYSVVERQESAFPGLQLSTAPTAVPEVTFALDSDLSGRYVSRIICENATVSEAPLSELTEAVQGQSGIVISDQHPGRRRYPQLWLVPCPMLTCKWAAAQGLRSGFVTLERG